MYLMASVLVLLLAVVAVGGPAPNPLHAHMVLGGTMEDQTRALAAHLRMGHPPVPWTSPALFQRLATRSQGDLQVVSLRDDPTTSLVQSVDHSPVLNAAPLLHFASTRSRLIASPPPVYTGVKPPPSERPPRIT